MKPIAETSGLGEPGAKRRGGKGNGPNSIECVYVCVLVSVYVYVCMYACMCECKCQCKCVRMYVCVWRS